MIQLQFLNYLLQTKDKSIITLNRLDSKFFSNYSAEWKYIESHIKEFGNIPDKETFLNVFPQFQLIDVEETPSYLISELFEDYTKNHLATTFNKIKKELMQGNTSGAIEYLKQSYSNISSGISLNCVDILKDTSRYQTYVDKVDNVDEYFVSTGFKELDDCIKGWDRKEELGVIIARSGVGKSWALIKVALAAVEQGLNVGLYSGEMSETKVGYRFDTFAQRIANGSLVHGDARVKEDYKKYIAELPNRFRGSLKVLTPQMINGFAGVNALQAFIEKENLDMLLIDQHSLLEDDRHARVPFEKAANISTDLKKLQVLKKIPIISVCQMNRTKNEGEDGLIDLGQISLSDKIGQDATTVIGLSRDKKDKTLLTMQIVKSRDNGVGKLIRYIVNYNLGDYKYIPEDEDIVEGSCKEVSESKTEKPKLIPNPQEETPVPQPYQKDETDVF